MVCTSLAVVVLWFLTWLIERVKLAELTWVELVLVEFVVLGSLFAVFREELVVHGSLFVVFQEELVVHGSLFVAYFVSPSLYSIFDESHLIVTQSCFVYPEFVSNKQFWLENPTSPYRYRCLYNRVV